MFFVGEWEGAGRTKKMSYSTSKEDSRSMDSCSLDDTVVLLDLLRDIPGLEFGVLLELVWTHRSRVLELEHMVVEWSEPVFEWSDHPELQTILERKCNMEQYF
jgi:hypothetical protein